MFLERKFEKNGLKRGTAEKRYNLEIQEEPPAADGELIHLGLKIGGDQICLKAGRAGGEIPLQRGYRKGKFSEGKVDVDRCVLEVTFRTISCSENTRACFRKIRS